ncbi:MAG: DNA adenine methylase [Pirellulales bacterium]
MIRQLRLTPYHEHEYSLAWSGDLSKDSVERARQIFVQLRMAFGGLGSRGVRPGFGFGKTSSKSKSTLACIEQLGNIVERLRSVTVMCRCGIDVIKRFDGPDTLHYCDPPYVQSSRAKGAGYLHEMSDEDHCRLAEVLNNGQSRLERLSVPALRSTLPRLATSHTRPIAQLLRDKKEGVERRCFG